MKAKRTTRNILSLLMVCSLLLSCGGFSALATEKASVSDGTEKTFSYTEITDTSDETALTVSADNSGSVADVTVDGNVSSIQTGEFTGITVSSDLGGEASATINGDVTASGSGFESCGAAVSSWTSTTELTVNGSLDVTNTLAVGDPAEDINTEGVDSQAVDEGRTTTTFTGDVNVDSAFGAQGVETNTLALSVADTTVGSVTVDAGNSVALGAYAHADDHSQSTLTVTGSNSEGNAVRAASVSGDATAIQAEASNSSVSTVTVESGDVTASTTSGHTATGVQITTADSGSTATVEVLSGGIIVEGGKDFACGVDARQNNNGTETVTVDGAVTVTGNQIGDGVFQAGDSDFTMTSGAITVTADEAAAVGLHPSDAGSAKIEVNGDVTAEGKNHSFGIITNHAGGSSALGSVDVKVHGDLTAGDAQYTANGIHVRNVNGQDVTTVTVDGNLTANGAPAGTLAVVTQLTGSQADIAVGKNVDTSGTAAYLSVSEGSDVKLQVGENVDAGYHGIYVQQYGTGGDSVDVTVGGNLTAADTAIDIRADGGDAKKMEIKVEGDEIADPEKGNVKGGRYGLSLSTVGEDNKTLADVVISGTLEGDKAPIIVNGGYTPDNLKLTVFEVKLNDEGHAIVGANVDDTTYSNERTEEMEKQSILYIIKVQQPEGAVLKALKEDGSELEMSHNYSVAKEGEKVLMKVELAEGYQVTGAYSVDDNENLNIIEKDGQYYVEVPKGGDVYISARLEKLPDGGSGDPSGWTGGTGTVGAGSSWSGSIQYVDVTFDFNGGHKLSGSTAPIVKTVPVGTWVVLVQAPLKDGAQFLGWKADKAGITVSKPGDNFCAWEPVTFTAMWSDTSAAAATTAVVTLQPAAGESAAQTVSAVQAAPTVALSEDVSLTLADLLGSASPTGEGSALQAKLVVDLPNGGSLEIPVNIQLSFGTPTIIDSP